MLAHGYSAVRPPRSRMPTARLAVSVPEPTWMHAVSTAHPEATFRVTSLLPRSDTAVAVVEVRTDEALAVTESMQASDGVPAVELLGSDGDVALLQVESDDLGPIGPARDAGVALDTPVTIQDGTATWELTTSADRLSAFGDHLEAADIDFDLVYRGSAAEPANAPLTDRQRELLLRARELGYYDTPRDATLTAVADEMDIAKATASDILHRAESALVAAYADGDQP